MSTCGDAAALATSPTVPADRAVNDACAGAETVAEPNANVPVTAVPGSYSTPAVVLADQPCRTFAKASRSVRAWLVRWE